MGGELPTAGSSARWGPLFGGNPRDWAETWEGPCGWGTAVYRHVLERAAVGPAVSVLDCGCGAGRFLRAAADLGAPVSGIDAAAPLVEIAAERVSGADLRVGDLERLPWPDCAFDVVTGLSSFQFADDPRRALGEARRVSRGLVAAAVPSRVAESDIARVFAGVVPLFPPQALEVMARSGMFALSGRGTLDGALAAAGLTPRDDDEVGSLTELEDADAAVRAFLGAGPTALAVRHSGRRAVEAALREALAPVTGDDGAVRLRSSFRVVIAPAPAA